MQCDEICNNLKFHHITLTLFRRQHPSGPYLKIELVSFALISCSIMNTKPQESKLFLYLKAYETGLSFEQRTAK